MEESFREALEGRVILFDGAMGTEIYARGVFINRSYDELNVLRPDIIREIHTEYLRAGAEVLTTNTFGGNRLRLQPYGLQDQIEEINRKAVLLAREVARDRAWVAGSIGPLGVQLQPLGRLTPGDGYQVFREQASVLCEAGVDLFILETFADLRELWQAFRAVRDVCDRPIVACMSFQFHDMSKREIAGVTPEEAARTISAWKPTALGTNCANGPRGVTEIIERMARHTDLPLAALPNGGLPQVVEGRTIYLAGPEYMGEYARRLVQKGASIVGGCCGTNPATISEMHNFVQSVSPIQRERLQVTAPAAEPERKQTLEPVPIVERSAFARKLYEERKFSISVELDPPRGVDPARALKGANMLKEAGVDVVNIADGPRAVARMGPSFLAQLVSQTAGMESVVHYCCRDRNLLGMQMDMLGAHAVGLHNILAVTGDPPKMGTFPSATAVFDIDAIGLISFIQMLNRGLDFSGQPVGGQTRFFVGAGCNPGHVDLDLEVERYGRKVEAGAEFFFSQPVYEPELLRSFLDRVSDVPPVPFLVGILPLASYKNAEFLHNEVPGMQIPDAVRERMGKASTRQAQRQVGIEVAQDTLRSLLDDPRIAGTYIFPPFGSYRAVLKVLEVLEKDG